MLLLIRHGKTVDKDDWTGADWDRPLSEEGREIVSRVAAGVAKRVKVDLVLCSPKVRTWETAHVFGGALKAPVEQDKRLLDHGGSTAAEQARWLGKRREKCIAVVGHEPDLRALYKALTEEDFPAKWKKAQVVALTRDGKGMADEFQWTMLPSGGVVTDADLLT